MKILLIKFKTDVYTMPSVVKKFKDKFNDIAMELDKIESESVTDTFKTVGIRCYVNDGDVTEFISRLDSVLETDLSHQSDDKIYEYYECDIKYIRSIKCVNCEKTTIRYKCNLDYVAKILDEYFNTKRGNYTNNLNGSKIKTSIHNICKGLKKLFR